MGREATVHWNGKSAKDGGQIEELPMAFSDEDMH
jgi:hypothetical protein